MRKYWKRTKIIPFDAKKINIHRKKPGLSRAMLEVRSFSSGQTRMDTDVKFFSIERYATENLLAYEEVMEEG
jgi:hypothetical protein